MHPPTTTSRENLPAQSQSGAYKWHVVVMLWCISFFNYADRQAIFSVFPLLEKEMGLTPVQLGLLGSSFAWVYGLTAPFAGMLVDKMQRRTAILAGLQVWSIICAATASSRNFMHLLFFRAAEGLGETAYYPASMSMISDYHGKETRSRAMGWHQTSVYVGTIAGGFFAALIGQHYGWRWSFVVFGGLGILLGVVLHKILREPPRGALDGGSKVEARESFPQFLRRAWKTPSVLLLMGAFMCANFVAVVLLSWMPKFLYDKFNMSLAMAGLTATIFVQLASMAGSPVGGWLADMMRKRSRRGRVMVQMFGVFLGAPFVLICGMTQSVGVVMLSLTLWGFFKGIYDANIWASLFDFVPVEVRGTSVGLMNMVGWLAGGGSAPLVIGIIAEQKSLGMAIAMASSVYIVAGVLLLIAILFFANKDAAALEKAQTPA